MDPISNQLPPYSQYDIEVYALQKAHRHVITQQIDILLPKPFEIMTAKSEKGELKKKKQKGEKQEREKGRLSSHKEKNSKKPS
ncbi:hypothetical protein [Candidatus Protochlamydia phocaeensis]|uniref:hypothetical protein n=1 Tax=Candidatus Protochlamydia phocaeensis TaxID=1414722 RepID=UPI0008396D02|nr:hypothetical protein [Candidatus Protochlamydia phocaeensis]